MRLEALSQEWGETIPPIQTAVINRARGFRAKASGGYSRERRARSSTRCRSKERRRPLHAKWAEIDNYQKWREVVTVVGLKPIESAAATIVGRAAKVGATRESRGSFFGSGGEGSLSAPYTLGSFRFRQPYREIPGNLTGGPTQCAA